MSDFNLSQDIDGFLLSNTTPQNAKSFNVLTVNSPFTSPTLRKQKLGTSDIFDSSNAPTPKQTFTTDFTKGQFTSPLISSGMPTPASALEKTPLLSKLLLNSKPRPVPAQLSPALLCKDVSKSQLRFSQDPSIDSSQNDEVEVTDKKPLISAQLRLPNKPNEFEQPEPPSTFRVLSLSTTNNRLGIATLDIDEGKLELSSMFLDPAECSTLDCYLFQSSASVVITHSKIPPNVLAHLKSKDIELEILPSADFSVDSCVQNFKAIPLGFVKNQQDERSLFISLASYISFEENNELTKAVGGVLAYFRNYIAAQPDELRRNYSIKDISTLQWDRTLLINEQSFSALYIFKKEQHPDVHSKGGSKEGLSLFGCLNKCITQGGSKLLKEWMRRVVLDRYTIEERHQFQKEFGKEQNRSTVEGIRKLMRKTKMFGQMCSKIKQFTMTQKDWAKLYAAVSSITQIIAILNENSFKHRVPTAMEGYKQLMMNTKACLEQMFNTEAMKDEIEIRPGYNEEFDQLTKQSKELNIILEQYKTAYGEKYCFFQKMGFLIESKKKGNSGWRFMFKTNDFSYFKDEHCLVLDEKIGDIDQQIKDAKTQIVDDLCLILNENNGQYIALSLLLNEFDVLLTFVTCNWLYGWNLPTITTAASPLIITQGRNPIVELVSDSFVPNDTKVDNVPVQIITGPNCSGKSVYLRQVGMNVYLGLLGCGIAAQYGEIPLIKRILTRITTKESTKSCLSAFTTDCSQMSEGLRTVDNECLFLIDEFGKGTDPSDGFALFSATVKYLQKLRTKAPKTLIATHFITVFQEIERDWCVPLMMDTKTDHTNDTIQFLYKLVPGITTAAYGIECAKIAGLPQNIVDRAFSVCKCLQEDKSIVPLSTKVDAEKYYDSLISKFIEFDTEKGDITEFLTTIRKVTNRVYGGKS